MWRRSLQTGFLWSVVFALIVIAWPASADYIIAQEEESGSTSSVYQGQSFTTTDAGEITQVDVYTDPDNDPNSVALRVYPGNQSPRDPNSALCVEAFSGLTAGAWQALTFTGACPVEADTQYTFEVDAGVHSGLDLRMEGSDVYPGGMRWSQEFSNPGSDLTFRVHVTTPYEIGQSDSAGHGAGERHGQSFTTVEDGLLREIEIEFDGSNNDCGALDLRVYLGNQSPDDPNAALYTESFSSLPTSGWVSLELSEDVVLGAGRQYTFEVKKYWSCNNFDLRYNTTNTYAGGHAWWWGIDHAGWDYAFWVHVQHQAAPQCVDYDGDSYGDPGSATCPQVEQDCDDSDPDINPGETEVCDGVDNNCVGGVDEEPASASCSDGLFCNGPEVCDAVLGCLDGTPLPGCEDDGLWCNGQESCDEQLDECFSTPEPCGSGFWCDEGADTCIDMLPIFSDGFESGDLNAW